MIEPDHPQLPIKRQCALVGISRSAFYGGPRTESLETFAVMRVIDGQFLETPRCGSRQMVRHLRRQGHEVGRKRVRRLMARMGLAAIYQRPKTTVRHPQHRVFPYLLRNMAIDEPDQVWCADITYIPMRRGFLYLVAIMDWHSRRALLIGLRTQSVPDCYGWRPTSASRHWRRPCPCSGGRASSTPTVNGLRPVPGWPDSNTDRPSG